MAKSKSKKPAEDKQMTSVRVSTESQTIFKLIKKRYKSDDKITTQDDAFLEFMKANHPDLYKEAIQLASIKRDYDERLGGDDD